MAAGQDPAAVNCKASAEIDAVDAAAGMEAFKGRIVHVGRLILCGGDRISCRIVDNDVCIAARGQ